jgi:hypothetical protein
MSSPSPASPITVTVYRRSLVRPHSRATFRTSAGGSSTLQIAQARLCAAAQNRQSGAKTPLASALAIALVRRGPMTDDSGVSVRVFTIFVAGLMFAGSARADEAPPPSYFACADKSPGDACEGEFGAGACVASTCSRLDYSKGSPPEVVSEYCIKCQPQTPSVQTAPVQSPPATAPAPAASKGACQIGPGAGAPILFLLALVTVRRRRCH